MTWPEAAVWMTGIISAALVLLSACAVAWARVRRTAPPPVRPERSALWEYETTTTRSKTDTDEDGGS